MKLRLDERGFHAVGLILAIVVVGAVGLVGYKVMEAADKDKAPKNVSDSTQYSTSAVKRGRYLASKS